MRRSRHLFPPRFRLEVSGHAIFNVHLGRGETGQDTTRAIAEALRGVGITFLQEVRGLTPRDGFGLPLARSVCSILGAPRFGRSARNPRGNFRCALASFTTRPSLNAHNGTSNCWNGARSRGVSSAGRFGRSQRVKGSLEHACIRNGQWNRNHSEVIQRGIPQGKNRTCRSLKSMDRMLAGKRYKGAWL